MQASNLLRTCTIKNLVVRVYRCQMSRGIPGVPVRDRADKYRNELVSHQDMYAEEFLHLLGHCPDLVHTIRTCPSDEQRLSLIEQHVPVMTAAVLMKSRLGVIPLKHRVEKYNPVIALVFEKMGNTAWVKNILKKFPYLMCAAVTVDGKGVMAIALIDNNDIRRHGDFFHAIDCELRAMGLHADPSCCSPEKLIAAPFDEDPWINPDCVPFNLKED